MALRRRCANAARTEEESEDYGRAFVSPPGAIEVEVAGVHVAGVIVAVRQFQPNYSLQKAERMPAPDTISENATDDSRPISPRRHHASVRDAAQCERGAAIAMQRFPSP